MLLSGLMKVALAKSVWMVEHRTPLPVIVLVAQSILEMFARVSLRTLMHACMHAWKHTHTHTHTHTHHAGVSRYLLHSSIYTAKKFTSSTSMHMECGRDTHEPWVPLSWTVMAVVELVFLGYWLRCIICTVMQVFICTSMLSPFVFTH